MERARRIANRAILRRLVSESKQQRPCPRPQNEGLVNSSFSGWRYVSSLPTLILSPAGIIRQPQRNRPKWLSLVGMRVWTLLLMPQCLSRFDSNR
ncbi:unnamed protein product, partial [Vitis vinifera]